MARTAYLDHEGPIPLAHRGFSLEGLENTMSAFGAAVDLGFRYVETDVHATSDDVVVAFHDERLDRVTDRTGAIMVMPYEEVRQAKIGDTEHVPTLEEMLDAWPDLKVNIDIKSQHAITPTVRVIERAKAHDRVCLASFSDKRRLAAQRRLSRPVAMSAGQSVGAMFRAAATTPAMWRAGAVKRSLATVDGLQIPVSHRGIPLVTASSVASAHQAGAFVHVWTINDVDQMRQLLDQGVDGIVSDRSDLLKQVLMERGQWS